MSFLLDNLPKFLTQILCKHKDPTHAWRYDPAQLTVDLANLTLNDAKLGDRIDRLEALGPTSDAYAATKGNLHWRHLGVSAWIIDDQVDSFDIQVAGDATSRFPAFPGRFTHNGKPVKIDATLGREAIIALLGQPFAETNEAVADGAEPSAYDDRVLFYETSAGEMQVVLDPDSGRLDSIECAYEPELADDHARAGYGIAKPFPDYLRRDR